LTTVDLCDNTIAVSSLAEKSFEANGRTYGHVIDPRTGWPVQQAVLSVVVVPGALLADALSTALLVLGRAGLDDAQRIQPDTRALVVGPGGDVDAVRIESASPASK
jgi:thiamine biosynthesis lipoprotein